MNTLDRIMETTTDKSLRGLGRTTGRMASVAAFAAAALLTAAARADDPYIESDGTSGISTGYRMKGTSRVEIDFAMPNVDDTSEWTGCKVLGTDAPGYESSLMTALYLTHNDQNTFFAFRAKTSGNDAISRYKVGVDTARHTAIMDLPHDKIYFLTGNTTNGLLGGATSFGLDFSNREAALPLSLFGRFNNVYATTLADGTKSRIYGVRIFENGIPVRNFVPCLKDGETPCFKDLVGGGFIIGENVAAFTAGGDVPTYADDGYVSTAANADATGGRLYFDTGYKVSRNTAVALDCALAVNYSGTRLWHLFDTGSTRFGFNYNKANGLRYNAFGASSYATTFSTAFPAPTDDKDVRRTFFIDNYNGVAAVVTSGFTNQTATFTTSSAAQNATTLKLSTDYAASVNGNNWTPLKIYGCKIWESGVLVRDYAPYVDNGTPGLRDGLTGSFLASSRQTGDTTSVLTYGGTIAGEQDACLQSNGTQGLSTGYKMKGISRVEVDFALTETNGNLRIFGSDAWMSDFKPWFGTDSAGNWRLIGEYDGVTKGWYPPATPTKCDTKRHTAIMGFSSAGGGSYAYSFVTGTTTNMTSGAFADIANAETSRPIPLYGRWANAEETSYACRIKAKIYSVRIYESDALVHEFLPYSRGGVVGFYDTVTGGIISNGSSFTFGGMGQDHGQLKAYLKPGYATEVTYGKTVTLTAYAPGATSYRWLMDGEPVAGGTDGTFTVDWARGGVRSENGFRHEYQAVAVYDTFYGVTRESEPSAAATVTSLPRALTIIVK